MKKDETVKLISAEGFEFIIDKKAAKVSQTIRNMLTSPAGPVLVAVNPFKRVGLYGNDYIEAYKRKSIESPHVYAIADTALREMRRVRVICNHVNSKSRGYGFVKFASENADASALKEMNGQVLDGRNIRVHYANK